LASTAPHHAPSSQHAASCHQKSKCRTTHAYAKVSSTLTDLPMARDLHVALFVHARRPTDAMASRPCNRTRNSTCFCMKRTPALLHAACCNTREACRWPRWSTRVRTALCAAMNRRAREQELPNAGVCNSEYCLDFCGPRASLKRSDSSQPRPAFRKLQHRNQHADTLRSPSGA
jgi:hypothetical protein